MKAKNGHRWLQCLLLASLILGCSMSALQAQWNFLGPQWIIDDSVSSHAIALNHERQVHVAATVDGAATVHRFDGFDWESLGGGLPTAGQTVCALAMDASNRPLLALGPVLRLLRLDNGNWLPTSGLPNTQDIQDLQLHVAQGGRRWLAWWQAGVADSTFLLSDRGSTTWYWEGAIAGRLVDMALADNGDPLVLLAGAPALLQLTNGVWNAFPNWSHPSEQYIAVVTEQDGNDSSAVVLRRNGSDDLSVDHYTGGSWQSIGSQGFALGDAADLGLSPTGILHVVSVHRASQGLPRAFQFVAGSWQALGGQYVYNNTVSAPLLAFDQGAAFVLFQDDEQGLRNSVMYLGSPVAAEAATESASNIYPNPAKDHCHLRMQKPVVNAVAQLCDATGRVCARWEFAGTELEMDLQQFPAGTYWLVVQGSHQPTRFTKITKIN